MPEAAQEDARDQATVRVFDTVVVGAGPAGTQCALHLGQYGADVLLAGGEHPKARLASMPREKCWASSEIADEISLRLATDNAARLGSHRVHVAYAFARSITWENGLLRLDVAGQTCHARAVVIATGHGDGDPLTGIDAAGLDLDRAEDGRIDVDDEGGTSHIGVYAIGDAAAGHRMNVSGAMGTASRTARALSRTLSILSGTR